MVKRSWLVSLYARLAPSSVSSVKRRRRTMAKQFVAPAMQIELLEQRQMLTAAITGITGEAMIVYGASTVSNPAVFITTAGAVTEPDATALPITQLTVTISGRQNGDTLNFIDFSNIKHDAYNPTTGVLRLYGADTVENYTSALKAITYQFNYSPANPVVASTRTLIFQVTDGAGASPAATRLLKVVNAAPILSVGAPVEANPAHVGETYPLTIGAAVNLQFGNISFDDPTVTTLTGVNISITGGPSNHTQDLLSYTPAGVIQVVYDQTAGTLKLSGTDTVANYLAVLSSLTYQNISDGRDAVLLPIQPLNAPVNQNPRTLTFTVTSPTGTATGSKILTFKANSTTLPPVIRGVPDDSKSYIYTNGQTQNVLTVTPSIRVTLEDNIKGGYADKLESATIQITGGYRPDEDQLVFTNTSSIGGTWDAVTGTLTLSGVDSLENYTTALASVGYVNLFANPTPVKKTITFNVRDNLNRTNWNGQPNDDPPFKNVTQAIVMVPVDTAPVITGLEQVPLNVPVHTTPPANTPLPLSNNIALTDPNRKNLRQVVISFSAGYIQNEDKLLFTNTGKITGTWNNTAGTLTLTGVDTLANYQAALRSVQYLNDPLNGIPTTTATRTVTFTPTNDLGTEGKQVSRTIFLVPTSAPPVLSGIETSTLAYTDHTVGTGNPIVQGVPVTNRTPISSSIKISDSGNINLQGAVIKIAVSYQANQDRLLFNDTATIQGNWNPATGELKLTGVDTLANYAKALNSVLFANIAYESGLTTSLLKRTVTFTVTNQSGKESNSIGRDIQVIHGDNPPTIAINPGVPLNVAYAENSDPIAIAPALTVADNDTTTLSAATIRITNPALPQDVLGFVPNTATTGNIAIQSYSNGILKLVSAGATATLAQWQAALRSVTYVNTSDNPNVTSRIVSFQITDALGLNSNDTATRTIVIVPINDKPVLKNIETAPLNWIENAAVPTSTANNVTRISNNIAVTDPDSTQASGARIQITAGYLSAEDLLGFVDTATITGTWDTSTGTLTLSGTDSLANYQAALRAVTYTNTSSAPTVATRTVSYSLTDISTSSGSGNETSDAVSRNISITPVNDPPVLVSLETSPLTYTELPDVIATVPVTTTLIVTDADSTQLRSATVSISAGFQANQDLLTFTPIGNITGSFNALTGVLTLTGVDSVANYQTALLSVRYQNTSHNPSAAAREIRFTAQDSGSLQSLAVTRSLVVVPTNNAPVLTSAVTALSYTQGTGAKAINTAVVVADVDDTKLASAVIAITNFVAAEDLLGFTANAGTMGNIAVTSNVNGILTLTSAGATATLAQWQAALRAVTYTNTSGNLNPVDRNVTFTVDDGKTVNNISNSLATTITINVVFPPTLTGTSSLAYIEKNTATPINTVLTVASISTTTLAKATISITNFVAGQDVLGFVNNGSTMGNISVQTNANGILTLISSGATATVAQWQAALRAVTYFNSSANPSTTTRNVTFTVDSGKPVNGLSNTITSTVSITPFNDPSVVTNPDTTAASYTEDAPGISVFPNLTVGDVDSANLTGAVVRIVGNYNALGAIDKLLFTNTAKITGTFNVSTGTLTLVGTDTVANYQAALRSVKFTNSFDLSAPPRTVSLTVTDDTNQTSNTVTRGINITTVNNAPILSGVETTAQIYKYNDPFSPPPVITSSISIRDYDSTLMQGAIASITTNYDMSKERLGVDISGTSLTASWNATTGQLSINGVDTIANYVKVLRTVAYINLGSTSYTPRTISFTVKDNTNVPSNLVSRTLNFVNTNAAPTLATNSSTALNYVENAAPTAITPSMSVNDSDSPLIQSAIIKISSNYTFNEDSLVFTTFGKIKGTFATATGTLTLTGADTLANYQTALQSVQYVNSSHNPSTATRTITFTVSDGLASSNAVTRNITIQAVNDAPVVQINTAQALAYQPANGAVAIAPAVTVTDPDNAMLASAFVQIISNYQRGKDVLAFVNPTSGSTITGSFDSNTGILKLTGTDTVSNYRAALAAITYQFNGVATTQTKAISFVVNDGSVPSTAVTRNINVSP